MTDEPFLGLWSNCDAFIFFQSCLGLHFIGHTGKHSLNAGDGDKGIQKGEILGGEDHCRTFGGSTQKEKSLKIVYNKVGLGDICSFPLGEDSTYFFNSPYVLYMKES